MEAGTAPVVINLQLVLSTEESSFHSPKQASIPLQAGSLVTDLLSSLKTAYNNQAGEAPPSCLTEKSFLLYDLTSREREVIELLRTGRSHKQIAAELHIASRTVGKHVENIYLKLGVNSKYKVFQILDEQTEC